MAIGRRASSKVKNLRYIEVKGVPNKYLDAALMCGCSYEFTNELIQTESKLLNKIKITAQDLKQNKYNHKQLIQLVSDHLLDNYKLFNMIGNISNRFAENVIKEEIGSNYKRLSQDQWAIELKKLNLKEEVSLYTIINFLRFYKGGEFKNLILDLLEENEAAAKFYQETNIRIDNFMTSDKVVIDDMDLPWSGVEKTSVTDDIELPWNTVDFDSKKQTTFSVENTPQPLIGEKLVAVIETLDELRLEVQSYEDVKSIKETLTKVEEKNEELTNTLKKAVQESKVFEARTKSLTKENNSLKKSSDNQKLKIEQYQKEAGRLGLTLGEIKQEKEEIEKSNINLNKQISNFERNEKAALKKLERDLKKEHIKELERIKSDFERNRLVYEEQISSLKATIQKEQTRNEELHEEFINVQQHVDQMTTSMQIVINERDTLLKTAEQSSINMNDIEVKEENEDLLDFEFNETDLEDFIEFNNKPNKN